MTLIIVLIAVGLLLLVAEFLIIPGVTIAGIGGFVLITLGVYFAYSQHGTTTGHVVLLSTAVASIVTIAFSLRAKTWNWVALHNNIDSTVNEEYGDAIKPGDNGITVSRLNPMGKAKINDMIVEVTALGELINQHSSIEVVSVEGNKITVKLKK